MLIKVDPGQLEQVIINLCVNARDAMPRGGLLTIETRIEELDERFCELHQGARPGRSMVLAVSDTGEGMTPQVRERIFEPFFTTKEQGKGTGLGLATVFGIVRQSDGFIDVRSEVGAGSTFTVYLPAASGEAQTEQSAEEGLAPSVGGEGILLVEDEEGVRQFVRLALESYGYFVREARTAKAALEMLESAAAPVQLLLTDVVMPDMSGPQLAEAARARVDVKVLFMSGYTDDRIVREGVLSPGTHFITKPFSALDLARKVRQALG